MFTLDSWPIYIWHSQISLQIKTWPSQIITFVEHVECCVPGKQGVKKHYRQVSNIRRTLVDNKIVDNSDVVGAPPVGAAPTTSSFST